MMRDPDRPCGQTPFSTSKTLLEAPDTSGQYYAGFKLMSKLRNAAYHTTYESHLEPKILERRSAL